MPNADMPARFHRVQKMLAEKGVDGVLSFKPQNTFFLSAFHPGTYSHVVAVFLPTSGDPALVIWANRGPKARATSAVQDIQTYGKWAQEQGHESWVAAVVAALTDRGLTAGRIGIEGGFAPVSHVEKLRAALPSASFVDIGLMLEHARMIKDPGDVAALRDACALTDAGITAAREVVTARGTEIEVSVAAMTAMQRTWVERFPHRSAAGFGHGEGGVHNTFWTYCLTGQRVRMNSAPPSTARIEDGHLTWVVSLAALDGMHAENERTFAVGTLSDEQKRAYESLLKIHEEGLRFVRPGVVTGDLYRGLADLYRKYGYGDYLPGRICHGMGHGSHEEPSAGPTDTVVLEPGMVMTYEPNLRIPSFGGLQHSDTLLVTETGFEYLTGTPRDFLQV